MASAPRGKPGQVEDRKSMMRRCFVCAADMLEPSGRHLAYPGGERRDFPIACASCGLLLAPDADPARCRADLA
ncbi:hypothetical protein FV229_11230, partial [Methylobacterium sp. WL120]